MHELPMHSVSAEFALCWQAAGKHLNVLGEPLGIAWLKANLEPPFLEHLSFRIGNQLFFVHLQDVDGVVASPGALEGLLAITEGCDGHACRMPMRRHAGLWKPREPGWGLLTAVGGAPVDPPRLVSAVPVEMTDWEVHDFAVQIVRQHLEQGGREIMSSQGNPAVDPAIWYVGDDGPEWVVVRAARYPIQEATPPATWARIAAGCSALSSRGNFASVSIAPGDGEDFNGPLFRGRGMFVRFEGLSQRRP